MTTTEVKEDAQIKLPTPHASQKTIADDAHRFKVINCGRRWGKTFISVLLCGEAHWLGEPHKGLELSPLAIVDRLAKPCADCAMKDEEIARLKRELAKAHTELEALRHVTPSKDDTLEERRSRDRERQRRHREQKKATVT